MERNSKNSNENKATNKASCKASNKASNAKDCGASNATNGKHPNQYTKGADDKSAKNANSKNCS